jgi:hypothetical protein
VCIYRHLPGVFLVFVIVIFFLSMITTRTTFKSSNELLKPEFPLSPGFRWSHAGAISGMRCTRVVEPSDPHTWQDNYLCVPKTSNYHFTWAYASSMRPSGKSCIQWLEPSDKKHTWHDNYLCGNAGAGPNY